MTRSRSAEAVQRLKQLLIESSPLIEAYTRQVCPSCTDVCCIQRHGLFTESDRAYLAALDEPVPPHDPSRPLEESCQFLTGAGCMKGKKQYQVRVPAGEAYGRVEGPKGELGFFVVSVGKPNPYRYHVRAPSFVNVTGLEKMCVGSKIADFVALLAVLDIVLGELDR